MFASKPERQKAHEYGGVLEWGRTLGGYGHGYALTWEGPREPGPKTTEITLRRVYRKDFGCDELQISTEITQRYRSGSNSRHMTGSMSLRGVPLADMMRRSLFPEDSKTLAEAHLALAEWDTGRSGVGAVAESLRAILAAIEPKG